MTAQPQQHDASASAPSPGRPRRLEAILVSKADEFLIELGPVLGDRYRVHTVESLNAVGEPGAEGARLVLVDADSLESPAQLQALRRGVPAIVVATDPSGWDGAHGDLVAVVPRADLAGSDMVNALHAAEARLRASSVSAAAPPASAAPSPRGPKPMLLGAAALAVIAVAVGGGLLYRSNGASHAVSVPAPVAAAAGTAGHATAVATPSVATAPQSVFELLSAARVALHDQKLLPHDPPRGDSAVELYAQVLIQDPHNEEAADGVRRLFSAGRPVIDNDIATGKLDEATQLIASFHAAGADADVLHQLDGSLAAARPRWLVTRAHEAVRTENLDQAQQLIDQLAASGDNSVVAGLRRELDAKKTEMQLRSMANDVHTAIAAGALTEPSGDSALSHLQAMRNVNRSHPLTLSAQHELQSALLARSQDAAHQGQFDAAQRSLAAAADIAPSPEVNVAKRELQASIDQAAQRAAAAAASSRAQAAQASAAASPSAAPVTAPARPVVPQMISARTKAPLDVQYPARALQAGIKGYAVIEFTLHEDGSASDATTVESLPKGLFDSAAVAAVLKGHFDTSGLADGQSHRARIRINFDPR